MKTAEPTPFLTGLIRACDLPDPEPDDSNLRFSDGGVTLVCAGYDYFIRRSRIDTAGKLLAWADHLSAKSWMNGWRLHRFIKLVSDRYNIATERDC